MSKITSTAIYPILADLSTNSMSRQEATSWAELVRDKQFILGRIQFRFPTKIRYWEDAWAAVASALLHESCERNGEPYFVRPCDYAEWLAILNQESTAEVFVRGIRPIRYHQLRERFHSPVVTISIPHDAFSSRLGINALHGADDLDYVRVFMFETRWGEQFFIENRPHYYPDEHDVYVELTQLREWENSIEKFLALLELTMDDVIWRKETGE